MSFRYLVCGAGSQGKAIAWRLAKFSDTEAVSVLDKDETALGKAMDKILSLPGATAVSTIKTGPDLLDTEFLKAHNVAVSALPTALNYELARKCLQG